MCKLKRGSRQGSHRGHKKHMGTQCVYVRTASVHMCVTRGRSAKSSDRPSGVLEKYRWKDTHSSGCVVRRRKDTINNKSTMVTDPAVIGKCRVSSVTLIYSHTCVHTCSVHTIFNTVHGIVMIVYSHMTPVFSAPCCHCIMPAVVTHFFLNNAVKCKEKGR